MLRSSSMLALGPAVALCVAVPHGVAVAAPEPVPVQQVAPAPAPAEATTETEPQPATPSPSEVIVERVETPGDEVTLRDGSFVRGSVVEMSKGSHVTITVGSETRRIEWAQLERIRLGTPVAEPTPAPAVEPMPAAEPAPVAEPAGLRVHMESTNGRELTLYRISGEFVGSSSGGTVAGVAYEPVCSGRCGKVVDGSRGHEFFVGGKGVTPSKRFTLDEEAGDLTLEVRGGSRGARFGGWMLVTGGAAFLASGVAILAISSLDSSRRLGAGFAVTGGISLVAGIPLMLVGRTIVERRRGR